MTAHRAFAALVVAAALGGCASRSTAPRNPDLAHGGSEAPVAVTVPSGPETLPTWERHEGRAVLVLPADLLFARDSADLGPAAIGVLDQVTDGIRAQLDSTARVLVEGHADSDGDPGHNQELSERRAAAVGDWLSVSGVDPSAITTRGWGEARPAVEEFDEAGKAQNRRVVVTVTLPVAGYT
jgi:outer membrane protein OmpA-like peptidoglycan-associated protein